MESLYPFLYADTSDLAAVLEQVRASTVAKAAEIRELRRVIAGRDGARLAVRAREMAARFAAGGRLFAFGNGGSATDAQQLATLFLHPGRRGRAAARVRAGQRHLRGHRAVQRHRRRGGVRAPARRVRRPATSRSGCRRAATRQTCCAPSTRRAGAGCSPSAWPATRAGRWRSSTASTTCSWPRRPRFHRIQEAQTTIYQVLWELTAAPPVNIREVSHVPRYTG